MSTPLPPYLVTNVSDPYLLRPKFDLPDRRPDTLEVYEYEYDRMSMTVILDEYDRDLLLQHEWDSLPVSSPERTVL